MSSAIPSNGQRGRVTIMGFNCFHISTNTKLAQSNSQSIYIAIHSNTQSNTQSIHRAILTVYFGVGQKGRKFGV